MFKKGVLRELFDSLFKKSWPMWVGGILLAFLNVLLFVIKYPWGASGGYVNIGQNLFQALGSANISAGLPINLHTVAILNIFIIIGAFVSALFSKEFSIKVAPIGELIKGMLGGALMGIGATVGIGCTTGGFFSGVPALSGGALFLSLGFMLGTFVALRYLIWEMEKLPNISMGKSCNLLAGTGKRMGWQRWLGWIVIALTLFVFSRYTNVGNAISKIVGWHVFLGLILGIILQRSRFCIVRAFREPFMTGESSAPIAVILSVLVALIGFTVIKYFGIGTAGSTAVHAIEMKSVYANFWLRALIGGFIFGLGMTIAGGCAVGALWRAGEGHLKLWMSILGFIVMAPISKAFIVPGFVKIIPESLRTKMFLPEYLGYTGAVVLVLVILLLWYIFVKWNEKTGKFSAI
ncbi:MAG: YeeE/YedE thiosulfate transporter family protein [Candidatus Marinimicrobia bacterium]|nr:YeeE/YedE thiosulfate transporter family protein [Candidatus Neomarinimicrobiota bacterium]